MKGQTRIPNFTKNMRNIILFSMNFNAEFYKFSFKQKNFPKFALLLTFSRSLDQIK
jgi:hypothetical protein